MKERIHQIWEEFNIPLTKFIKKRIPREQDAEDVLQDIFIKIHNNHQSLINEQKVHNWIYTIARNEVVDYYRRKNRDFKFADFPEDLTEELNEDLSFNGEISDCLKVMVERLPKKYKEAIMLTEFNNVTQKELSQRIGISLSGAKSRVQRGREKIKEMLLECCHFELDHRGNIIDYKHKDKKCKYC